jgi:proline iminopeptidase
VQIGWPIGCTPSHWRRLSTWVRQCTGGLRDRPHDVVINGVRLWYRVAGKHVTGVAPVVFLHGGPGQGSYHFAALAGPYMEPSLRLVYFDQRGSGQSERPWTGEYGIAALIEDIEGLRRKLGVPRIALIGHSFGGALALEYAARYPEHVSAVVFVAGLWDAPLQLRYRCRRIRAIYRDAPPVDSARGFADNCDWVWKLPNEKRQPLMQGLMFPDSAVRLRLDSVEEASGLRHGGEVDAATFKPILQYRFAAHQRLTMPVLVIAGRHDGAAASEGLRDLTRLLPDGRYVEYHQSGHFVYLDEPERFARDVTAFLTSQ